jgi:hypothetical protein
MQPTLARTADRAIACLRKAIEEPGGGAAMVAKAAGSVAALRVDRQILKQSGIVQKTLD